MLYDKCVPCSPPPGLKWGIHTVLYQQTKVSLENKHHYVFSVIVSDCRYILFRFALITAGYLTWPGIRSLSQPLDSFHQVLKPRETLVSTVWQNSLDVNKETRESNERTAREGVFVRINTPLEYTVLNYSIPDFNSEITFVYNNVSNEMLPLKCDGCFSQGLNFNVNISSLASTIYISPVILKQPTESFPVCIFKQKNLALVYSIFLILTSCSLFIFWDTWSY